MNTDTIVWGQTYDIEVAVQNQNGEPITLDDTYQVACRVVAAIGGPTILEPPVTISGGKATASIDTRNSVFSAGTYHFDVRITDPDGYDDWTEPVKLTLLARITPASS